MSMSPVRQQEQVPWMIWVIQSHLTWFGTLHEYDAKAYFVLGPLIAQCPFYLISITYFADGQKAGVSIGRTREESNVM
jgi:hypothetical protein